MDENQIKNQLGIKDWRYFKKDMLPQLIPTFKEATPETIKAVLNQLPEFAQTSREMLINTKDYYKDINKNSTQIAKETIEKINSIIINIQKVLDEDKTLSFENKQWLIEKEVELIKMIKDTQSEQNKFFEFMANNWGKIAVGAGGVFCLGLMCLTPGGKDIVKGLFNVDKAVEKISEKIV